MWNITNPQEVLNGSVPIYEQYVPFALFSPLFFLSPARPSYPLIWLPISHAPFKCLFSNSYLGLVHIITNMYGTTKTQRSWTTETL
jgi:hypothetical protein